MLHSYISLLTLHSSSSFLQMPYALDEYGYLNWQPMSGLEEFGSPVWRVVVSLIVVWILVGLTISFGAKSIGKVIYIHGRCTHRNQKLKLLNLSEE